MSVKIIVALLALFLISSSLEVAKELQSQYVPISNRYPGIDLPGSNPLVTVELVYDPTCNLKNIQVGTAHPSIRLGSKLWTLWHNPTQEGSVIDMRSRFFPTVFCLSSAPKPSDTSTTRRVPKKLLNYCNILSLTLRPGRKKPSLIPLFQQLSTTSPRK